MKVYVPPGLWGVGIGEAFLRRLVAALGERGCRRAVVLTPRTCGAHWHTLYSSAAFSRLTRAGADGVESTTFEKELAEVPPV